MESSKPLPETLMGLAERVEAAGGANFVLEQEIGAVVFPASPQPYPAYTASLDAALSLVPEGLFICLDGPRKYLNIPTPVPNYWRACFGYGPATRGWGATPALALTAAALRALAMKEGSAGS